MKIQCAGSINSVISFSGVSPEGLQRLHNLVLEKENIMPFEVKGTNCSFNNTNQRFIEIMSAELETDSSKYGYNVSVSVAVMDARGAGGSGREVMTFFAPTPRDLLLKLFLAVHPNAVPEVFAYIAKK